MSRRVFPVLALAISVSLAGSALAQVGPGRGGEGRDFANRRFETSAPGIGEPMPDLVVYDAGGKELRLRELLRDHYTVLVLGCLT